MKIEVKIDLDDFIERWGDDTLEQSIKDDIKHQVMKAVKSSEKYKALVQKNIDELCAKLDT